MPAASLLFASCASILNSRDYTMKVVTDSPAMVIVDADTLDVRNDGEIRTIALERSRHDRKLIVIKDSLEYDVKLRSRLSPVYWANFGYWLGFLIDINTPKKWEYVPATDVPNFHMVRSRPKFYNESAGKGVVNLRLGIPCLDWFNSAYEGHGRHSEYGFTGISAGLDYFYNDKMFINVSGVGIINFLAPFPGGIVDHMASVYGSVSRNHMLFRNRLSIGYGISYGHDVWNTINHRRHDYDAPEEIKNIKNIYRHSNSLGLVMPFYYYTSRIFYAGVIYRPMFLQFADKTRFKYQHTISVDLGWRIRLTR